MIAVVIDKINDSKIRESIDLLLALSSFDMEVALFLEDEGVLLASNAYKQQNKYEKDILKYIKLLKLYDINLIYLNEHDLYRYEVKLADYAHDWLVLSAEQFSNELAVSKRCLKLS